MKVKIFRNWDTSQQEMEVNEWLEKNEDIVIHNTIQSSTSTLSGSVYSQITIFYSELAFEKIK
jgi:predicted Holliday junction resolvase-like endonuclease